MTFSPEQTKALEAPLSPSNVKRNPRGYDYVESWHAEAEANRIFGFGGWSSTILDAKCVVERERKLGSGNNQYDGWGVSYIATVRVTVDGVERDGVGAGHGMDKDLGLAHESALKEAASDAEKRALKTFGNQFGLALYDKTKANVGEAEPETDPAAERAIIMLRDKAKDGAAAFKAFWEMNKDAWKTGLTANGYAELVSVMQSIAADLKPKAVA